MNPHSQMAESLQAQTKKFPTLGLGVKNKDKKLDVEFKNPFSVHHKDELLYMKREKQRQKENYDKFTKEKLRIEDKGGSRPNRAGKIRMIDRMFQDETALVPFDTSSKQKSFSKTNPPTRLAITNEKLPPVKSRDSKRGKDKKQKLANEQVKELKRIEDDTGMQFIKDDRSEKYSLMSKQSSIHSSDMAVEEYKPKNDLIYLQQTEKRESCREYIQNIRSILLAEMAINDKKEETERIRELIKLKEDKLNLAKKQFDTDVKRFTSYLDNIKDNADQQTKETEKKAEESHQLQKDIALINNDIIKLKNEIEKEIEKLKALKIKLNFLNQLSPNETINEYKTKRQERLAQRTEDAKQQKEKEKLRTGIFLTEQSDPSIHKNFYKSTIKKEKPVEEPTEEELTSKLLEEFPDVKELGVSKYDSDSEYDVFFTDPKELMETMHHLETTNLFQIYNKQELEYNSELSRKEFLQKKEALEISRNDVKKKLEELQAQLEQKKATEALLGKKANLTDDDSKNKKDEQFSEIMKQQSNLRHTIWEVFKSCDGKGSMTMPTLEMLKFIELKLHQLLSERETWVENYEKDVKKLEDGFERKRRADKAFKKKMEQESKQDKQKEIMRKRAEKPFVRKVGKDNMFKTKPKDQRHKKKKPQGKTNEDETDKYFLD